MSWPHTFAALSGDVPAPYLDDNFNVAVQLSAPANTLLGNNTGGTAAQTNLTPSQVYAMLKGAFPWEVAAFMGGVQGGASWQIMRYQSGQAVIIDPGNYVASASVAATGSTVFTIADNGSSIGTATFPASGASANFSFTASLPYTLSAGHVLTITGPVSPDATLANVNITLGGTRG
jgi:hypothetical protein